MLKFTSFLFCLFILCSAPKLNAQQKVAYVDYSALLLSMPETKVAEVEYTKYAERWDAMYTKSLLEYMSRDSLIKSDSSKWLPAVKDLRKKELVLLGERITAFSESRDELFKDQNAKLLEPIQNRALTAIEAVVKENGFTKWIDKTELAKYPGAKDIMALVKKKLANTQNLTTEIKFENTRYNMGNLEEKAVEYNIKFTNTGKAPLNIINIKSSSGCAKLQWPQKAIKSGDSGIIKLTYNGVDCPGVIIESIEVSSNAIGSPQYLEVKGYVGSFLKNRLSEQFFKIMQAFPGNFESLKDGVSNAANSEYFSKISIEQSRKTGIIKGKESNNNVLCLISTYDSKEKGLQKYQELLNIINSIKLNGVELKVYKTEHNEALTSTKWRLDNSKNKISKEYQQFTIELTCLYMDKKSSGVSISFGGD